MKSDIHDVARLAGVSTATVSRVINGNYPIKPSTRQAVLDAIKKLDYIPNRAAATLSGGRSKVIGFVCPKVKAITNMHIASGIEKILSKNGYGMFIASSENTREKEKEMLKFFSERSVDAILVSTCYDTTEHLEKIEKNGIPVIMVDRYAVTDKISAVKQNAFDASYRMGEYLTKLGHKSFAIVNGPMEYPIARDRQDGFLAALKDNGITIDPSCILDGGKYDTDVSANAVLELAKTGLPSVIYATGEAMTMGVMRALQKLNLRVPEDISVASYGHVTAYDALGTSITGIMHMYEKLGEEAAKLALKKLDKLHEDRSLTPMDDTENVIVSSDIFIGNSVKDLNN